MATKYTSQYLAGIKPGSGAGTLKAIYGSYEIGTALSAADIIVFCTAPVGFTPLFGWLQGDDIDTGTETLEIDVGITGDTTKYLDSGVLTGDAIANEKITVGIKIPLQEELMTVKPTAFTTDTDIIGTITAVAAAGGTGTITLVMVGLQDDPRVV